MNCRFIAVTFVLIVMSLAASILAQTEKGKSSDESDVKALMDKLQSQKPAERARAATALGKMGKRAKPAVPALIRALKDKGQMYGVPIVATSAASALGSIGPAAKEAVPALVDCFDSESWELRGQAVEALGRLGIHAADAVPALIRFFRANSYTDVWIAMNASKALLRIPGAERQIVESLADSDPQVSARAAETLAHFSSLPKGAKGRLTKLLKSNSSMVRAHAAATSLAVNAKDERTVGRMKQVLEAVLPELLATLKDPKSDVVTRMLAAHAIGRMGETAKPAIAEMIKMLAEESNFIVRVATSEALASIRKPALSQLRKALGSKSPKLVEAAAIALREMGPAAKTAVPELNDALKNQDSVFVAMHVLDALRAIGPDPKTSLEFLIKTMASREWILVTKAMDTIGVLGQNAAPAVDALIGALGHHHVQVRTASAEALGKIGPAAKRAVSALQKASRSTDESLASAAREALKKIQRDKKD